jgi:serine/threonine protein kinase
MIGCLNAFGFRAYARKNVWIAVSQQSKSPLEFPAGTVISDDFVIKEVAGHGSFAIVYRANQRSRGNRQVALKVLHRGIQRHLEQHSTFVRNPFLKVQLLCERLRDPGICRVVKVGSADNERHYIALEWATGITLDNWLKTRGQADPAEVIQVVDQLAGALLEAHRNRVVHRDVKPSNVMIDESEGRDRLKVRLLDFGIAKFLDEDDVQINKPRVGTPAYMSPEQAAGQNTDMRADVYGLAAVAYEILTSRRPVQLLDTARPTSDEYMTYLCSNNPIPTAPLASFRPDLPSACNEAINRALERNMSQRIPTVAQFREMFAKSLSDVNRGKGSGGALGDWLKRLFNR